MDKEQPAIEKKYNEIVLSLRETIKELDEEKKTLKKEVDSLQEVKDHEEQKRKSPRVSKVVEFTKDLDNMKPPVKKGERAMLDSYRLKYYSDLDAIKIIGTPKKGFNDGVTLPAVGITESYLNSEIAKWNKEKQQLVVEIRATYENNRINKIIDRLIEIKRMTDTHKKVIDNLYNHYTIG